MLSPIVGPLRLAAGHYAVKLLQRSGSYMYNQCHESIVYLLGMVESTPYEKIKRAEIKYKQKFLVQGPLFGFCD